MLQQHPTSPGYVDYVPSTELHYQAVPSALFTGSPAGSPTDLSAIEKIPKKIRRGTTKRMPSVFLFIQFYSRVPTASNIAHDRYYIIAYRMAHLLPHTHTQTNNHGAPAVHRD